MLGQLIAVVWELIAATFIALVVLTIRKARARGKRLFVDEVNARIDKLAKPPVYDHSQDAM